MRCPKCNGIPSVTDSRPADGDRSIRRRRRCKVCRHKWTTYERAAVERAAVAAEPRGFGAGVRATNGGSALEVES